MDEIGRIVAEVLQLSWGEAMFKPGTQLLGSVPEFDSMAVVSVLTAIEENYGIMIDDDEISAEIFESLGSLQSFVDSKVSE